jgi:hypothetical protein
MRQLLTLTGYLLAFFVAVALALLVMALALRGQGDMALLTGILGALVMIVAAFLPYLNFAMRRSFVHPAEPVPPLPEAELRARLRALAKVGAPVEMIEAGGVMRMRWAYLDARLRGVLEVQKLESAYELQIRLDPARNEAVLTDIKRSLRLGAGVSGVRLGLGFTRGWLVGVEMGRGYDVGMDLSAREAFDYRFEPAAIKRPVLHVLAQSGWTARFAMW